MKPPLMDPASSLWCAQKRSDVSVPSMLRYERSNRFLPDSCSMCTDMHSHCLPLPVGSMRKYTLLCCSCAFVEMFQRLKAAQVMKPPLLSFFEVNF